MEITKLYTWYGQRDVIPIVQEEARKGVKTVIIDDGYPEPLGKIDSIDVYRINEDIQWNQAGAKNLGYHVLDGWVFYSSMDNIMFYDNWKKLQLLTLNRDSIYFFPYMLEGRIIPRHENPYDTFLIHADDFNKVGGFDEDFSGEWGYEDTLFYDICCKNFKIEYIEDIFVIHNQLGVTSNLVRDVSRRRAMYHSKKNNTKTVTPKLRFTWQKLE